MYLPVACPSSLIFLFFIYAPAVYSRGLQFCEKNPAEQINFCIALNAFHNDTSGGDDFYFTMSTRFPNGRGWLAVGSGSFMDRSLMFVMYPDLSPGVVTISARTTRYHQPPRQIPESLPEIRVIDTALDDASFHTADFICYSCSSWDGNPLELDAQAQPWVWASNPSQEPESDSPDVFFMDMTISRVAGVPEPYFLEITPNRLSTSAGDDPELSVTSWNQYLVHGIIMCSVFGIIFPLGVTALLHPRWASVRNHWIIQCFSASSGVIRIYIAFSMSWYQGGIRALGGFHQLLGCLIGLAFFLQVYLGYSHHISYLKVQASPTGSWKPSPKTQTKFYHKWLGRTIYTLGAINATLGLLKANTTAFVPVVWAAVIGVEALLYWFYLRRRRSEEADQVELEYMYDAVGQEGESLEPPAYAEEG
ncbi:hypothetical protein MMC12_007854 [Toensbergia leucococca]|nr:hypothetical protein [Toensbergia leucococca]